MMRASPNGPITSNESGVKLTESASLAQRLGVPDWQAEEARASVRFVRLCGQAAIYPRAASAVKAAGAALDPNEWRQVVHIAANEGMAPLVYLQAASAGLLQVAPPEMGAALADSYRQTLVTNRSLMKDLHALLTEFDARGIEVIPLKGLSLAARYYEQLALRPTSDIDLLVRRRDVQRSDQALRELGYHSLNGQANSWNFDAMLHGDLGYANPKGTKIELHWELTHRPTYRAGLAPEPAWSRAQTSAVAGKPMRRLSVSDELRFLCVHCTAGHQVIPATIRLIWLVDIAKIVSTLPTDWDWSAFIKETVALRLATPLLLALSYAASYLNLEVPPDSLALLRDACDTRVEQDAWRFAQGGVFTARGILAHLNAASAITETLAFIRGVMLPSPTWIRQRYNARSDLRHLPLWRSYARYYGRLLSRLPELLLARIRK
jgi:hypothetical protein